MISYKLFVSSTIIFISICLFTNSFAKQYVYTDDEMQKEEKLSHDKKMAFIGKTFWVLPANMYMGIEFSDAFAKKFSVSQKTSFKILELLESTVNSMLTEFRYKVLFDDGKVGYLKAYEIENNVMHMPTKYYKDFWSTKIFDEDPDIIRARLTRQAKKAASDNTRQAKKAASDNKARGGVTIGMTKEQVLKSNWGKPNSKNNTITSGLTHEQWVYSGGGYLYFENGILAAIQN